MEAVCRGAPDSLAVRRLGAVVDDAVRQQAEVRFAAGRELAGLHDVLEFQTAAGLQIVDLVVGAVQRLAAGCQDGGGLVGDLGDAFALEIGDELVSGDVLGELFEGNRRVFHLLQTDEGGLGDLFVQLFRRAGDFRVLQLQGIVGARLCDCLGDHRLDGRTAAGGEGEEA
jgi:hypothetical protein